FAPFSDGLIVAGYRDSSVCLMKAELNGENPVGWIPAQSLPLKSLGLIASDDNYLYIQFMQKNTGDETRRMMMVIDNQGIAFDLNTEAQFELMPISSRIPIRRRRTPRGTARES
ncbi:MAG: hypothetical protein VB111_10880, partial [Clostridiaceae bacterium]|nr:hypothetical protein [Clostridiaceae bacterium]